MKKTYPIIKVGDFLYAVDKRKANRDEWVIYANSILKVKDIGSVGALVNMSDGDFRLANGSYDVVVATNNPSLKGVLQLPPEEENVIELAHEACKRYEGTPYYQALLTAWIDGYSEGQYSEEDMEAAYNRGFTACEEGEEQNPKEYLKSLSKVPKAIEVECWGRGAEWEEYETEGSPKNNNGVVCGTYIY